jgi:hypothetical protein
VKFATIYALLFGNYYPLHIRLLTGLKKRVPPNQAKVVIWGNQVGEATKVWLAKNWILDWPVLMSTENVPKYRAMRRLFHSYPPQSEWVVWFDDDTRLVEESWWFTTRRYIEDHHGENICYVGEPWYVHHLPGQWDFIQKATWFKGRPPEQCPTRMRGVTKPGITFAQGAYWWLRTDVLKALDWPDKRLNHNGGDTLLGEAVRQQGLPFHKFSFGVKVNDASRRGMQERPAGSRVDTRR